MLRGLPCAVMISGYPSVLYDGLLRGWRSVSLQVMNQAGVVTEKVWFNFEPDRVHWARYAGRNFTHRQTVKRKAPELGPALPVHAPGRAPRGAGRSHGGGGGAAGAAMKRFARYLERLRECFARMPDRRRGSNRQYAMQDIGMAALSVFFMQSPSFLAHQRALAEQRGRSNAHTLFGLDRIPCDNRIRQLLDGVGPEHFDGLFNGIVEDLQARGGLEPMRRLDGRALVALDGTQYFRSRKIHCPNCSTRQAQRRRHRVLPSDAGRHPGGPGPCPDAAAAAGFRPSPGRRREAGLRTAGGQALAAAPRPPLRPATAGLPGRRPVRLPAGLPGDAGQRRRLPAHLQAGTATRPSTSLSAAPTCPRSGPSRAGARGGASTTTAGWPVCPSATAPMLCASTGWRSPSRAPTAPSPTATPSSPIWT